MFDRSTQPPGRPAWIEINLDRLRNNFALIQRDKPPGVSLLAVVKDEAYGHGAATVARAALQSGAVMLAVATLDEAHGLRKAGIDAPILLLGERAENELPWCLEMDLDLVVGRVEIVDSLERLARKLGRPARVHIKINTGMNRYGARWTEAMPLIERAHHCEWVELEGVMSHFSMSDETDKSYAELQLSRFREVLRQMETRRIPCRYRHLCNSGGFLDLPQAHYDLVRVGILALGIYPSQVCRRIPGMDPVMEVKCRLTALQTIQPGDCVGYGMRFAAPGPMRIGVLPLGYGDGYPRVRNQGEVLLRGRRIPVVGANAMDAIMVDVTGLPEAAPGDEVVLMGRQGDEVISVHDVARWGGTVSYDILCGWRARLPRICLADHVREIQPQ